VAPERALQNSVEQLRRIVDEFADFDLFIVSPLTRYVARPCCVNTSYATSQTLENLVFFRTSFRT
jgi:hypothetical protein